MAGKYQHTLELLPQIKELLRELGGPDIGGVRAPLYELQEEDMPTVKECAALIRQSVAKYC